MESSRTAGATSRHNRGAAVEVDAIGEQQLKSGSSSQSGRNREAVEADVIGGAAAEADVSGMQQLKQTQSGSNR